MKKYLVGVLTFSGVRAITVTMPDSYEPGDDEPDSTAAFPVLRKAVMEAARNRYTSPCDHDRFSVDRTEIISISPLTVNANDTGHEETLLEQRVNSGLRVLDSSKNYADIAEYLPENAAELDASALLNCIQQAIE